MSGWASTTRALIFLSCVLVAEAQAEEVSVDGVVSADLRVVSGTICAHGFSPDWVDPMTSLPEPQDDRTALRTWPLGKRPGRVEITPHGTDTHCAMFTTTFPDRIGSTGWSRRWGSWANA